MLERLLSEIEPGRVRLILASDPTRLFDEMETLSVESLNHDRPTPQLVGCAWESLPLLSELISDVLDALAETALACWPNWYAESPRQRFGIRSSRGRSPAEFLSVETLRSFRVPVLEPWLRAAIDCCARHQLPRPSGFTDPVQAAQLTLAIDPARFVLLLVATAAEQSSERLDGLARAAEWFARATNVPVAVVVPDSLAGNPALDSISFDALQIEDKSGDRYSLHASEDLCTTDFRSVDVRQTGRPSDGSDEIGGQLTSTSSAAPVKPPDRSRLFVWPLQGVPHPRSEGEQLLARRLRQDDELGPLFEFNQSVRTSRESLHTVDLLWRAGCVIVEVDGYRWHSSREMFTRDRQRDYELTISGFVVLRLTHGEVVRDVELAIEKIRDIVRFHRNGRQP